MRAIFPFVILFDRVRTFTTFWLCIPVLLNYVALRVINSEDFYKPCSFYINCLIEFAQLKLPALSFLAGIPWSPSPGRRGKNEVAFKSAFSSWGTTWRPACLTSPWRKSPARLFPNLRTKWRVENTTAASVTLLQPSCLGPPCVIRSPPVSLAHQNVNPSLKQKSRDRYSLGPINSLQRIPCQISSGPTFDPNWIPWTP